MTGRLARNGPTGRGWAVLGATAVLLAFGVGLGYATLTGIGLAGAAALTLAAVTTLRRPRVRAERTVEADRVSAGESTAVTLDVVNMGRLPAPGFDAVELVDGRPLRVWVGWLAAGARRTLRVPIAAPRRGLLRLGPVVVERLDPLGLVRRTRPLSERAWLWVHPRRHPMRPLPLGHVPDFEGRLAENLPAGSTSFVSLREYHQGDDPRHIHWASTARTGTLMVREHVDSGDPTTTVLLDTRAGVLDEQTFEEAAEFAASVVVVSRRAGHRVDLAVLGEEQGRFDEAGGHGLLDRLAAATRGRDGGDAEGELAALIQLVERAREGGALVLVSGPEPGLAQYIARVRRRFARVVIVQLGAASATSGRPGLMVLRAPSATDAANLWSRLVARRPS
ncbi:DUF58 domain-containing protein [Actinomadura livida]|uniref:Uncharacterized protein (DUF58 family) n=1 Tax=Actinomadura livida TaxID=79909 RepID=A0A7W7I7V7_9ACTN|nr:MULTISPECIES: DUF58 domain-containing protein [Actinomadura]MBB4771813.1 uncharacterized protein (DUF58 family) [Actinomadura catellatispora]GGU02632.1 hypothetical protein GCM10010208_28350 [Actinomadura livida]